MASKTKSSKTNSKKEQAVVVKQVSGEIQKGLRSLFEGEGADYLINLQQSAEACAGLFVQLSDDVQQAEQSRLGLVVDVGHDLIADKSVALHGVDDKDAGLHDVHSQWLTHFREALLLDRLSAYITPAMLSAWDKHDMPVSERLKATLENAPEKEAQAAMAHTTQVRSDCAAILSAIQLKANNGAFVYTDEATGKSASMPEGVNPWDTGTFKQVTGICRNIRRTMLGIKKKAQSSKPMAAATAVGLMQKVTKGKAPLDAAGIMAVTRELIKAVTPHVLSGNEAYWKANAPQVLDIIGKAIGVSQTEKAKGPAPVASVAVATAEGSDVKQGANVRSIRSAVRKSRKQQPSKAHGEALAKARKSA